MSGHGPARRRNHRHVNAIETCRGVVMALGSDGAVFRDRIGECAVSPTQTQRRRRSRNTLHCVLQLNAMNCVVVPWRVCGRVGVMLTCVCGRREQGPSQEQRSRGVDGMY